MPQCALRATAVRAPRDHSWVIKRCNVGAVDEAVWDL